MNILLINSYYYPDMIGGAEHSVKFLAEGLVNAGHCVAVLCVSKMENAHGQYSCEQINGVTVYRDIDPILSKQNGMHKLSARIKMFNNQHSKSLCDLICKRFQPDVVHTNNLQFISTFVWKYFSDRNIAIVFTARDYWLLDHSCVYNRSNAIINYFYKKYYRHQSGCYIDVFTAPSNVTLNIFKKEKFFKNVYSIRVVNCIDLDMQETHKIIESRKRNSESFVKFLYVGALGEYKGIINLLKAFHSIQNQKICLTICGSGNENLILQRPSKRVNQNSINIREKYGRMS